MNKIISIILIFSIFYSTNCNSYTSSELAYLVRDYIVDYVYGIIDINSLVSPTYFKDIKELLNKIHNDETRKTFLIVIEEFDFSFSDKNHYMKDFLSRVISDDYERENYIIFIYSVDDAILLNYAGTSLIDSEDIDEYYAKYVDKYDNYEDVLVHFLEDVNDHISKKSLIVSLILVAIIAVIAAIAITVYCFYKKKKCCWKEKNQNQNQGEVNTQQQMNNNYMNNNYQNQNQYNYNQLNINNNNNVNNVVGEKNNDIYNYQSGGNVNLYNNNNQQQPNVVYYSQQGYSSHNN